MGRSKGVKVVEESCAYANEDHCDYGDISANPSSFL